MKSACEKFLNCPGVCDMKRVPSLDPVQQAQRDYLESRILSAQPAELIEMLYQIALQGLKKAIGHLKNGDAMARAAEISRAQEAVNELMAALDHSVGASFTQTLASLYAYVQQQILKGHAGPSEDALQRAIGILATLQEGWSGVCTELAKANQPATTHTPHVEPEQPEEQPVGAGSRSSDYYQEADPVTSRGWSA
ncbi:MAG TPA: flagellar export chaperone FliS [Bryobacteraceae bacterium]|jgi:flagellar protein FliS|nr:flagellar export chaperone FliS [Bryobacteraceae bacterium]